MRGIDALAAACEPEPATPAAAEPLTISDAVCEKIAGLVLQQLQSGLQAAETPEKDPDPEPEQAGSDTQAPEEGAIEE